MASPDRLTGALSLCRKAGKLAVGFDAVRDALRSGEAKLLLFAADTSPATRRRVLVTQDGKPGLPQVLDLDQSQDELAQVTRKPAGVLAVTDDGLAALVQKAVSAM